MAIISRNNKGALHYRSNQLRFGMIYVLITFVALLFLNLFCSKTTQDIFYNSKHASMENKILLLSSALEQQDVLNADTVQAVISELDSLKVTRTIITDAAGRTVFDSLAPEEQGAYCLYPEVVQGLLGNDVITIDYHDGLMISRAAAPIVGYDTLTGCAYILEYDAAQGQLIRNLQYSILTISMFLILVILVFTILFSKAFTSRLRRIMASMRIIRDGDYSHQVKMGGRDELTALGREFNDLTARLRESEELRRQFVSDASHELKTPLASIKLLSDSILQNEMDTDTVREFVADIGDEADRLTRMSEKLLSLTRIDPDSGDNCEITFFEPTIARVARMLSTTADMAFVTIETEIIQDSSILIMEDDLYQIIFNLAENGIKYNVPDGTLTIRLTREQDNAVLTIADTGMGIPAAAIGHIFERFYRVDKARSRQTGGSGLGLAIVRDMVQRNRGTICVTSRDTAPTGTTFTLTFPVFDVEEEA